MKIDPLACCLTLALLAGTITAPGRPAAAQKGGQAAAHEISAQIISTGSTNISGYTIRVDPNGHVDYSVNRSRSAPGVLQHGQIDRSLVQRFFHDIQAAQPLARLPVNHIMKSVSFGTSTYVEYQGQRTPDLSAPADARGKALQADAAAIAAALPLKKEPRLWNSPGIPSK